MTNVKGNSAGLARWALALATVLAADVSLRHNDWDYPELEHG